MQTDKVLGTCWPQSGPPKSGPSQCSISACLNDTHKALSPYLQWPLLSIHAIHANNATSSRSLDLWLTVGVGALVSDFSLYLTAGLFIQSRYPHQDTIKGVCLPHHFPCCLSNRTFIMDLALHSALVGGGSGQKGWLTVLEPAHHPLTSRRGGSAPLARRWKAEKQKIRPLLLINSRVTNSWGMFEQ